MFLFVCHIFLNTRTYFILIVEAFASLLRPHQQLKIYLPIKKLKPFETLIIIIIIIIMIIIIMMIIIIIIPYFYRVIQSAINIAAIKRSPV